jgi:hypothetical protein
MAKIQRVKDVGPNGTLKLDLGARGGFITLEIIGGPFDAYRPGVNADVGVCVRAERVPAHADHVVPILDFSVPTPNQKAHVEQALMETLNAALNGKRVWVGCMGGWGRTGLFLALLAKASGVEDPIGYVRAGYTPHAVETLDQIKYVHDFDVSGIHAWLAWRAWGERAYRTMFWWAR